LETDEKRFGDLTLVKWESRETRKNGNNRLKTDENMNSFLFTLKNLHIGPGTQIEGRKE
jgi:hypothetical protein